MYVIYFTYRVFLRFIFYRKDAYVRCLAWHPHANKFAVALKDDSIKIYQANRLNLIPLLKHKLQKAVTDMGWRFVTFIAGSRAKSFYV